MADNLEANAGSGGATFRTDDLGGVPAVHVPFAKILLGGDGVDGGAIPGDGANGIDVDVTRVSGNVTVVDGGGSLTVDAVSLPLPTGAATLAEQQTQTTALQLIDDVVHSGDAVLGKYAVIGAQLDDTTPGTVTEDNARALRMTSGRGLHVNLRAAAGTEIGTAGAPVRVDPTGTTTQPISAASLPLPTGAATAALQTQPGVDIGDVTVNNAAGASAVNIQDGGNSITVDAASLPLPTGASTLAEQQTQTTSLQLIDDVVVADNAAFTDGTTKLAMAGYIFDEVAGTALTENDAAAARIDSKRALIGVIEDATTRGQRATVTASNALKVDGSAVTQPVSGTVTANLAAGTNTNEVVGDVAQDAPIGGNPLSVGLRASIATPAAMSLDGDSVYAWGDLSGGLFTRQRPAATSTLSNVASSATSVTLLAANTARIEAFIMNDSTSALMVKLGATASATSFTKRLAPGEFWPVPQSYRGVIDGIWQAVQGNARMTELTS